MCERYTCIRGSVCVRAHDRDKKEDISHKINDMGETDRYDNMHACENAGKKARQLSMCFCL